MVDPAQYIACSELRKKHNPVFADVSIDKEQTYRQWPEPAVPTAIRLGAQGMDTLHTFNPTLDGPATMKVPTCNLPSNEQDPGIVDDDAADTEHNHCEDNAHATENDTDASTLPVDLPAEYLIGIQEEDDHTLLSGFAMGERARDLPQINSMKLYSSIRRQTVIDFMSQQYIE